jgi:uncharacterized damage-inducible protein DinB
MKLIPKPSPDECAPYAPMYVDLVPADGSILQHLSDNFKTVQQLVATLSEAQLLYRYAPGKWTIKEVLVHIVDDERIYTYRAMCFARGEQTPLPGFEQEDYAANSGANERSIESIMEEYEAVRRSTIALFNSFTDEQLGRWGTANGYKCTVRGLLYHLAGHELHHLRIIKEKYLSGFDLSNYS